MRPHVPIKGMLTVWGGESYTADLLPKLDDKDKKHFGQRYARVHREEFYRRTGLAVVTYNVC